MDCRIACVTPQTTARYEQPRRRVRRAWRVLLSLLAIGGCAPLRPELPPPPLPDYWPTQAWRKSSPEAQGMDSELLAQAVDRVRERGLGVDSLLIVRHGYVVLDAYFYPYSAARRHDVASVTKSVTATLTGIAIDEGLIGGLDARLSDLLPEAMVGSRDPRMGRIAIRDLLSMSSGLRCGYTPGEPELLAMLDTPNWMEAILHLPMAAEPGREFAYCSGNFHLLSAIVSRRARTPLLEFARARLFTPLGIRDVDWPTDPQGLNYGWGDLRMRPRDLAKIGLLYLQRGRWEDRQIVSAGWVERATHVQRRVPQRDADYGYGWWVMRDKYAGLYEARGRAGQFITVMPEQDAVAVFTGGYYDRGLLAPLLQAAFKSDRALPENPAGRAHLERALAAAPHPPAALPTPPLPARAQAISGQSYRLGANPPGLETFALRFDRADSATLTLTTRSGRFEMPVGLDGLYRISEQSPTHQAVGLKGLWRSEHEFVLRYDDVAGPNSFILYLTFEGATITLRLDDPSGLWNFTAQAVPK